MSFVPRVVVVICVEQYENDTKTERTEKQRQTRALHCTVFTSSLVLLSSLFSVLFTPSHHHITTSNVSNILTVDLLCKFGQFSI